MKLLFYYCLILYKLRSDSLILNEDDDDDDDHAQNDYSFFVVDRYVGRSLGNSYCCGSGTIWLDEVACTGSETYIGDCRHYGGWGSHDCSHSEDVAIRCY